MTLRAGDDPWCLYNLADDPTETNDLSDRDPERVKALKNDWKDWARDVGVASLESG